MKKLTIKQRLKNKDKSIEFLCETLGRTQREALQSRKIDWSPTLEYLKTIGIKIEISNEDFDGLEYGYRITMQDGDVLCPSYCHLKEREHDAMELAISVAFKELKTHELANW